MPVLVACPHCSVKLSIPETLLGKKVRCATCSQVFESAAPAADAAAPMTEELPEAPLDEAPLEKAPLDEDENEGEGEGEGDSRRRRERRWSDDDEDDDDYDDRPRRRRSRRRMRRDLVPHRGSMVLTLGILSVVLSCVFGVFCCFIAPFVGAGLGIPAVIMGHADLGQMRAGNMDQDGEGQSRAGLILGYVGIGLAILLLLGLLAYVIIFVLASTAGRPR